MNKPTLIRLLVFVGLTFVSLTCCFVEWISVKNFLGRSNFMNCFDYNRVFTQIYKEMIIWKHNISKRRLIGGSDVCC